MLRHKLYLQTKSLLRVYVETYFGQQRMFHHDKPSQFSLFLRKTLC